MNNKTCPVCGCLMIKTIEDMWQCTECFQLIYKYHKVTEPWTSPSIERVTFGDNDDRNR